MSTSRASACIAALAFALGIFPPGPAAAQQSVAASPSAGGYVGQARCATCHALEAEHWSHTVHARIFNGNPRNELEKRGCEACHGPGERHAGNPADKTTLVNFTRRGGTPVELQVAQCMQCHKGKQRIFWGGSVHQRADLSCSDCHNPMARFSAEGLLRASGVNETCYGCHAQSRAEFLKRSHMPLAEGRMSCSDCHNPHGSGTRGLLKADSVNHLCYNCHQEKRGPFLWEHAPVRESCLNCHQPHGSSHEKLLVVAQPFLCQQCHGQILHPNDLLTRANIPAGAARDPRAMNRGCANCHAQVHGSNHPSGVRFHR